MALWQQFTSLEVTSTNLVPTLKSLLGSREDLQAVSKLTGPEAQKVVDSLNQVCNGPFIAKRLTDAGGTTTGDQLPTYT